MPRILVTGGAGFIGAHLTERLLADDHEVVVVDDFSTGVADNLRPLSRHSRLRVFRADVAEPMSFAVDRIFHLACPASPVHYQRDAIRTLRTAIDGTRSVLELARRCGARVVTASTSEIYGEPQVHPQPESYWGNVNPIGPRACYDEGKRVAETFSVAYAAQHGVDARIVRIFNTYGPRMRFDDGRVVSNFVHQALCGEPLTVYGDGSQTRSLCFVDDLVRGLLLVMDSEDSPGPVNLGNPDERSVGELAELVLALTGSSSPIVRRPLPVDDPTRRRPDIRRALALLGWRPEIGLADGLAATIAEFRHRLRDRGAATLAATEAG